MKTLKEGSPTTKIPVRELRQPQFKLIPHSWEPSRDGPRLLNWTDNTATSQNLYHRKITG